VTADCRCPELAPNVQLQRPDVVYLLLVLNSWFINETETSFTLMYPNDYVVKWGAVRYYLLWASLWK